MKNCYKYVSRYAPGLYINLRRDLISNEKGLERAIHVKGLFLSGILSTRLHTLLCREPQTHITRSHDCIPNCMLEVQCDMGRPIRYDSSMAMVRSMFMIECI